MAKQTSPLTKSILTGEGILAYAVSIGLAVATAIPNTISLTHSAIFITVIAVFQVLSRTLLKVKAIQQGFGQDVPTVDPVDPSVVHNDVADVIAALVDQGLIKAQSDPAPAAPAGP